MSDDFARQVDRLHEAAPALLGGLIAHEDDVAELFAERTYREHLTIRYGRRRTHGGPAESYDHDTLSGTGIRLLSVTKPLFRSSGTLDPAELRKNIPLLRSPGSAGSRAGPPIHGSLDVPPDAPDAASLDEKRSLLTAAAEAALSLEPDLTELDVSYQGACRRTFVFATDGPPVQSGSALVGIRVGAAAGPARVHAVGGGKGGLGRFIHERPEEIARECIDRLHALQEMQRDDLPEGDVPVVIASGWGGVWLHETVGHLLEADAGGPFGPDSVGRTIGAEITIIDDGKMEGGRGSGCFDDEGAPAGRTTLVDRGVLKSFLTDRHEARRRGLPRTANGRRQDYRHEPLPRMTNLMLLAGEASPSSLIADVRQGLFVRLIGNGTVRPESDSFSFDVVEGYRIERGRLTRPITGVKLSGRPSEMLKRIAGVADDFRLDPGRGVCVKAGQAVPVSVGMPTILLERASVSRARR